MRFDEKFIQQVSKESVVVQGCFPDEVGFSIDTRTLQKGDIFIALQGASVDGHEFLAHAFAKGASGIIIARSKLEYVSTLDQSLVAKKLILTVDDPFSFFMQAAALWRAQFSYPVVAITGSVGKTSTKQLLSSMLTAHNVEHLTSYENQNTRIGVALTILAMRERHQVAVFEVGISKRGEMAEIAQLLKPTAGIITSIGHSHMEGLGSLSDIAAEKRDIFKYFTESSIGIIHGDQPLLAHVAYSHPVIKFGRKTINQVQARKILIEKQPAAFTLKIYKDKYHVVMSHVHEALVFNALAAASAAHLLGVSHEKIVQGIQNFSFIKDRFESKRLKDGKGSIINDCYNANPESMKASLVAFHRIETKAQKIAVLGDMLELGLTSPFWHRQLGRFLRKISSLNHVILVGSMIQWTRKMIPVGISVECVSTWQEAIVHLKKRLDQESLVLVKGSQGMKLKHLVDAVSETENILVNQGHASTVYNNMNNRP